jgi:hypothetical protein
MLRGLSFRKGDYIGMLRAAPDDAEGNGDDHIGEGI